MGAAALAKLPKRLDRRTAEELFPAEFFDAARFNECVGDDGKISLEVVAQRGEALECLSRGMQAQADGLDVLPHFRAAALADPSFWTATQAHSGALAAAGRADEAADALVAFGSADAKAAAQLVLLNGGATSMNAGDLAGADARFSRAKALGPLPPDVRAPACMARYYRLRGALRQEGAEQELAVLRSEVEGLLQQGGDEALGQLLVHVEAAEALAAGLACMDSGNVAKAAPLLESAADKGERQGRALAAESYVRAAIDEFMAFAAARQGSSSSSSADPPRPKKISRALSDGGTSALATCEVAVSRAVAAIAAARKQGGSDELLARLGQLDGATVTLREQIELAQSVSVPSSMACGAAVASEEPKVANEEPEVEDPEEPMVSLTVSEPQPTRLTTRALSGRPSPTRARAGSSHSRSPGPESSRARSPVPRAKAKSRISSSPQPSKASSTQQPKQVDDALILEAFRRHDSSGDGRLTLEDFTALIRRLSPGEWDDAKIKTLWSAVDANKDGYVWYEDFTAWICGRSMPADRSMREVWRLAQRLLSSTKWAEIGAAPRPKEKDKASVHGNSSTASQKAEASAAPPLREKDEMDLKVEAARRQVAELMSTLQATKNSIAEAEARGAEAMRNVASVRAQLDAKMDEANAALEKATTTVLASFGDKEAQAELRKSRTRPTVPPPPKALWKRPDANARREAARAPKEKELPRWFRPCASYNPIDIPEVGEWLSEQKEAGQNFTSFQRSSFRKYPHGHCTVVELLVVGPWPENAPALDALVRFCESFFCGCKVRVAEQTLRASEFAANARCGAEGQLQLCIGDIFDALRKRRAPKDVFCTVAITVVDIYPIVDGVAWNFVFGQAHMMDGIGTFSFSRHYPSGSFPVVWTGASVASGAYDTLRGGGEELDPQQRSLMLRSACKVLAHETGHILGIRHCIYYQCLMNGSNNLEESAKKPLHLCPVDLRKLQLALACDVESRYRGLAAVCAEFGWEEDARWYGERLATAP